MATVRDHYDGTLAEVYAWMLGGMEAGVERNERFFRDRGIAPQGSGAAADLGAGCGFQSIPLARAGFSVTAVDVSPAMLDELGRCAAGLDVRAVEGDLADLDRLVDGGLELAVCMTDTILHLESEQAVADLFRKVHGLLEPGGRFVCTFRDLSGELSGLDRFIPVRSDERTIFTCFLEYEPQTVKVHDLVYTFDCGEWRLKKSFYRKLRLSAGRVEAMLEEAGFELEECSVEQGVSTFIAVRRS